MNILNIMSLSTPFSAILSALIFNAIIIPCLIPIAMRGVKYKPMRSEKMLLKNMSIYGPVSYTHLRASPSTLNTTPVM